MRQKVVIIGCTGSIGEQALDVVRQHPDRFQVVGLAAGRRGERLAELAREFAPQVVGVGSEHSYPALRRLLPGMEMVAGEEGLAWMAALPAADTVLVAVTGVVGILPTLAALQAGKRVALANKETLVAAGDLVMRLAAERQALLLPVDSEHSAIFQCLEGEEEYVRQLWLTASGGPFRDLGPEELRRVTPEMALQHPTWNMGPKITIDSATLMNKGLEVIEAHHLFGVEYDQIAVVIHPRSIVHSLVEFVDGAFIGHLGVPDMRIPIQYALSYPERWPAPAPRLDLTALGSLDFYAPDLERFPALALAYAAGRRGGTLPAVMNAANEEAVQAFLQGRLGFTDIAERVAAVMDRHRVVDHPDLAQVRAADAEARELFRSLGAK
ncbi:MAG: 1-deoxy-D-xylulose-5-phosphate reductoisomerase [Syntrophomonadaceae bacterium]|jgi:1-deoxy-D-xylulose-5-phosphate reductoisomerase|nr:1-deoxy-D-xylulose-5-phosphate reductoisomerase [Syntrophomonadaceae bacterium]